MIRIRARDCLPDFPQVADVGVALEKPQQFVDDGLEMNLFGGQQREAITEGDADLGTKNGDCAGSGAVVPANAFVHDTG